MSVKLGKCKLRQWIFRAITGSNPAGSLPNSFTSNLSLRVGVGDFIDVGVCDGVAIFVKVVIFCVILLALRFY